MGNLALSVKILRSILLDIIHFDYCIIKIFEYPTISIRTLTIILFESYSKPTRLDVPHRQKNRSVLYSAIYLVY